jgi:predicted metal-dependent hydrolase
MQLGLPFGSRRREPAGSRVRRTLLVGNRALVVTYVRHRRARHYIVRVEQDGSLRATLPRGGSREEADRFIREKAGWIERERYRVALSRSGEERQQDDAAGDAHKRLAAAGILRPRLIELAAQLGRAVAGVTIRSQRTRWGSCSPSGRISLNWRLADMPESVRDYVLLHELTHLVHLNHSKRFWRELERVCPWHREARAWLRVSAAAGRGADRSGGEAAADRPV